MRIIVLFNLKEGITRDDYERWARERDIPGVRSLVSVKDFEVWRATGLLGGGDSPYAYVEVIDLTNLDEFMTDVATQSVQDQATEFRAYADNPVFIVAERMPELAP